MTDVELPALRGLDPLGFLAALGAFRLVAEHVDEGATLRWSDVNGVAVLGSRLADLDEVAEALHGVVSAIPDGASLPDVAPGFPLRAGQSGGDPMRMSRTEFRERYAELAERDVGPAARWLEHLVTDLVLDDKGRCALSPWMAPSGKQTVETFTAKSLELVRRDPEVLGEALRSWRRHDGFSGEYLDHRVLNDAADDPSGDSNELGVPGATWLAVMALPLLAVSAVPGRDRDRAGGTLWRPVGRQLRAVWPLWRPALGLAAVRVLLDHPALTPDEDGAVASRALEPLGVFAVGGAVRRPVSGRKSAGVLAPVAVPMR